MKVLNKLIEAVAITVALAVVADPEAIATSMRNATNISSIPISATRPNTVKLQENSYNLELVDNQGQTVKSLAADIPNSSQIIEEIELNQPSQLTR